MNNLSRWAAPAVALCLPLAALAQPASTGAASPGASAPPLQYRSAFADYKPWRDVKPGDWRAVNDTVRDAGMKGGGNAVHGMGGSMPSAAPASAPAPAPKASAPAAPGNHSQHGSHK